MISKIAEVESAYKVGQYKKCKLQRKLRERKCKK